MVFSFLLGPGFWWCASRAGGQGCGEPGRSRAAVLPGEQVGPVGVATVIAWAPASAAPLAASPAAACQAGTTRTPESPR
jgi:hypothetical protein